MTEKASQAEVVKNQVQIVKEKAEALVAKIAEEKAFAEEKLEAAKPALEEAEAALNTIKPAHIATVRKLGRPPHLIMRIMDCVLIFFQRKMHPCIPDPAAPCPKTSWQESLKVAFEICSSLNGVKLIFTNVLDDVEHNIFASTSKLSERLHK